MAVADIDDAAIVERHCRRQACFSQGQSNVVSPAEMLVDQGLKVDIGENVAAVSDKRFCIELRFYILNAAAGLEEIWLMDQLDRMTAVTAPRKSPFKKLGQLVRVDDERLHAEIDQMIEREGDERLLKNRDEWLGPIVSERAQTGTETGAKDERLCD